MQLLEYYKWQITLDDGHIVDQSKDGEKETFKFDDSNSRLNDIRVFKLIPKEVNSHELSEVIVNVPDGAKLIYFRRTVANTGNAHPKFQLVLAGWQMNTSSDGKGKNFKHILYIYPNGNIITTAGDNPPINGFIKSLPKKDPSEIVGCSGCKPVLVKSDKDEK